MENWILSIYPALLLLLLAWLAKRQFGSWLVPSAFFGLYWGMLLLIPLILAPDFDFWPGAAWFILFLGCFLHFGVLIGAPKKRGLSRAHDQEGNRSYKLRSGKQLLIALALMGLVSVAIVVSSANYSLLRLLNPIKLAELGRFYATKRYVYRESIPHLAVFFNIFLYLGNLMAGIWFATEKSRRYRLLGALPLLVGLLYSSSLGVRSVYVWMISFFISSFLATSLLKGHLVAIRIKHFAVVSLSSVLVFLLLYLSLQVVRENRGAQGIQLAMLKTRVAFLSSPFVFSHWLKKNVTFMNPAFGIKTFGGLGGLLGKHEMALGWEGSELTVNGQTYSPNVYTAFRQLVEDFTVPGAILIFTILGIFLGKAYGKVISGEVSWLPVLVLFYAITLGSYLANLLYYTSLIAASAIFVILLSGIGPRMLRRIPMASHPTSYSRNRENLSG